MPKFRVRFGRSGTRSTIITAESVFLARSKFLRLHPRRTIFNATRVKRRRKKK